MPDPHDPTPLSCRTRSAAWCADRTKQLRCPDKGRLHTLHCHRSHTPTLQSLPHHSTAPQARRWRCKYRPDRPLPSFLYHFLLSHQHTLSPAIQQYTLPTQVDIPDRAPAYFSAPHTPSWCRSCGNTPIQLPLRCMCPVHLPCSSSAVLPVCAHRLHTCTPVRQTPSLATSVSGESCFLVLPIQQHDQRGYTARHKDRYEPGTHTRGLPDRTDVRRAPPALPVGML